MAPSLTPALRGVQAIIRVLETAPIDKRPLVIKTDSAYSINGTHMHTL